MSLPSLEATRADLFFTKEDPTDPRLGEIIQPFQPQKSILNPGDFVIVGYPDDEGVQLNGGRLGAKEAPDEIRRWLYRMTPVKKLKKKCWDIGNLKIKDSLEERHKSAKTLAEMHYQNNQRWISLGGGHDYGYPDSAAFVDTFENKGQKPLVLNFDAHLDVRPTDKGYSSGTPFYRLLTEHQNFNFYEIGVQSHCNSQSHFQWAQSKGAKILSFDQLLFSDKGYDTQTLKFLEQDLTHQRPAFISIDIDGFSNNFAMGCSQSWATGLEPASFFRILDTLCEHLDIRGLGIYEVSPPLDSDSRTSKLAAQIIHRFLFQGARSS